LRLPFCGNKHNEAFGNEAFGSEACGWRGGFARLCALWAAGEPLMTYIKDVRPAPA